MKPRELCIVILLFAPRFTDAQNRSPIDSIKLLLEDANPGDFPALYYNLGFEYFLTGELIQAGVVLKLAQKHASENGDTLYLVKTGRLAGQIYRRLNDFENSIFHSHRVLDIAKRNSHQPAFRTELQYLYNSLGVAYTHSAEFDSAIVNHFNCLSLREKESDLSNIAETLNNIGVLYYEIGNYLKALDYLKQSKETLGKVADQYFMDNIHVNIGLCNIELKDYHNAITHFNTGLSICKNNCEPERLMEANYGLGIAYFYLRDFENAKYYLNEAYRLSSSKNWLEFRLKSILYLIKLNREVGNLAQTEAYLGEVEPITESSPFNAVRLDLYREASLYYSLVNDYERASGYQEKFINLTHEIYNAQLIESISKVEREYSQRQNLQVIKDKNEKLEQQQTQLTLVAVIATLLLVVLVLLFLNFRRKIQFEKLLERKVKQRTRELEANRNELQQAMLQQNATVRTFYTESRGVIDSLIGISHAAEMESQAPFAHDYLRQLRSIAGRLENAVHHLKVSQTKAETNQSA